MNKSPLCDGCTPILCFRIIFQSEIISCKWSLLHDRYSYTKIAGVGTREPGAGLGNMPWSMDQDQRTRNAGPRTMDQDARCREQGTKDEEQVAGNSEQGTGCMERGTGNRVLGAGSREQVAESR